MKNQPFCGARSKAAAVGDGGKDADKDGSEDAGMYDDVQGSGSDGAALLEIELGSDGGYDEGDGGVSPSGGPEDSRDVRSESHGGWMGVVIGGGGLGVRKAVANEGVHSEAEGYHCRIYR